MKILYLANVRIPSEKASGLAIVRQCQAFAEVGHEVDLLVPKRGASNQITAESEYGIIPKFNLVYVKSFILYHFGKFGLFLMLLYESLQMFFYFLKNNHKHHIIYSRDQKIILPFVLFGFANRCYLELHTKHTNFLSKFVIKKVKKVIVISRALKELYEELSNRKDIVLAPSGVDTKQFANLPPAEDLKIKYNLPLNKTVFSYVGKYKTMGESKGVDEIVQAFALALKQRGDIFLFLVGIDECDQKELVEVIKKCHLPDSSYKILPLDQKKFAEYVMASDVLLMNYPNTEHYAKYMSPTKLFAYMAAGKPIVSSDLPSIRTFEIGGIVYTKPDNLSELTYAFIEMRDKLGEYQLMSKCNLELVKKYRWDSRVKLVIS